MASGREINAGGAAVFLRLDRTAFASGLKAASTRLKAFGASIRNAGVGLGALGSAITAPLVLAAKMFADTGVEISGFSKRTGVSIQTAGELAVVAHHVGLELGDLANGFKLMQKSIFGFITAGKDADGVFSRLDITMADLKGLDAGKQFELIADRISKVQDPAERTALTLKIFGRAGAQLLPLLLKGAAGIQAMRAEAEKFGLVLTEQDVTAAMLLKRAIRDVSSAVKGFTVQIGAAIAGPLTEYYDKIVRGVTTVTAFIKSHREMVIAVLKIGTVLTLAGAAFIALGFAIQAVGFAFGGFVKVLGVVSTVLGVALSGLKLLWAALMLALTPLGMIVAGAAAFGVAFLALSGILQRAASAIGDAFSVMKDVAVIAFGGIRDAMMKGDIEGAGKILMLALQIVWKQGVAALVTIWEDFKATTMNVFTDLWANIKIGWITVTAAIAEVWLKLVDGLQNAWIGFQSLVLKGWEKIIGVFDKDLAKGLAAARGEMEAKAGKDIAERDQQRQEAISGIHAATASESARIKAEADAAASGRANAAAGATQGLEDEIKRLRDELKGLAADAAAPPMGSPGVASAMAATAGAGAGALQKLGDSAIGGFNASRIGLLGLQRGGDTKDMVKEQRTTNEKLDEVIGAIEDNALAFD